MLSSSQDAFGHEIFDYFRGRSHGRTYNYFRGVSHGLEIVEKDDGFINAGAGPRSYLSQYEDWSSHEQTAIRFAKGRVLDIGCGGGRHSLYLQSKGLQVVGVDVSPLAIRVCKLRGLRNARVMSITQLGPRLGKFDTILMLGNNFGLFSNVSRARMLLRRFLQIANPGARIIAESLDIYKSPVDPFHRDYHERNRRRGRMPGQVRIRVRYRRFSTPWFDYLLVSKREMRQVLHGTGWRVSRFIGSKGTPYIAVIERG